MRFLFVTVTILALSLMACSGSEIPASGTGPENTPVETPEHATSSPTAAPSTPESSEGTPTGPPEHAASSPTAAPPTPTGPENTLIETPQYTGVLVSEDGALEFSYLFDEGSTTFWEPSIHDISSAEECIQRVLVSVRDDPKLDAYQKDDAVFILENLGQYRRQYVGIDVDGAKRIWINAFYSDNLHVDWKQVPVDVDGGGRHFWQIEYDLLKNECINFHVHGES